MPNPKENLSKCCKAKVRVMGIGESNNYWECSKCGKSCNVLGENIDKKLESLLTQQVLKGSRQRIIEQIRTEERQKIKEELLAEFPKDEIKPDWKKGYKDEKMKGYWEGVSDGFNQACREHREIVEKLLKE